MTGVARVNKRSLQFKGPLLGALEHSSCLVLADPPWGLGRGEGRHYADGHGYRRDHRNIIGGYVDVDPAAYEDFTHEWVQAAAAALRPGGQAAIVTGPQRAAIVQYAAEHAGLTWVSSIVARRQFSLYGTRRPVSAHWTVTVMTRGPLARKDRVFNPPPDQLAASGALYPLDWWPDSGRADRPGRARYDNALPLRLVMRIILAFTNLTGHVVDPFLGSGTSAIGAYETGRRFTGGDVNRRAVLFAAARLLTEHVQPAESKPALFSAYH
jgi:DNA modification methylase